MKKGLLILFSGPSGVGKGTILKEVMKDPSLRLIYSVSMTTRQPRKGEIEGVNYFFVSEEDFKSAIDNNELLEYAEFVGNMYGTPYNFVEEKRNEGFNVLLEIDVQGALQIMAKNSDVLSIFIAPPDLNELEKRIRGRKTEKEEVIKSRINQAKFELEQADKYDYIVYNKSLSKATKQVKKIIYNEMNK